MGRWWRSGRAGSRALLAAPPAELSDLVALPFDVLATIFAALAPAGAGAPPHHCAALDPLSAPHR